MFISRRKSYVVDETAVDDSESYDTKFGKWSTMGLKGAPSEALCFDNYFKEGEGGGAPRGFGRPPN